MVVEQHTITERDVRALLDIVDARRYYVDGEQFPHEAMRRLQVLIPSLEVGTAASA